MKRVVSAALSVLIMTGALQAQTTKDAEELRALLQDFLAGASRNDAAMHDHFWADDLIYTGSAGRRRNKSEVMHDVRSAPAPKPGDPTTTYTAEEIRIQLYGDAAIVAFRLVGTTIKDGMTQVANFLNSGTFIKRKDKWQVVNWQATRLPLSEAEVKREVATAETAFHQAILAADTKRLAALVDESFIWTDCTGAQVTRKQLLDQLGSGQLKYSKLETKNVTLSVYGDAAVVRGVSVRQRGAIPAATGAEHAASDAFYTLTFVNSGGWKAVAMHSSQPNP